MKHSEKNVQNTHAQRQDFCFISIDVFSLSYSEQMQNNEIKQHQMRLNLTLTVWTSWSSWGQCSQTCGTGVQHRTRNCTKPQQGCDGSDTETRQCFVYSIGMLVS